MIVTVSDVLCSIKDIELEDQIFSFNCYFRYEECIFKCVGIIDLAYCLFLIY